MQGGHTTLLFFALVGVGMTAILIGSAFADSYTTVASPVPIDGEVSDGDIVSYDAESGTYHVTRSYADENVFGVVVDDPVLYMDPQDAVDDSARPVVRYGEARVNVSDLGGSIRPGDLITTSPIPGVGQRANYKDVQFILGFALDAMRKSGEEINVNDAVAQLGSVSVALRIGPHLTRDGVSFIASTTAEGGEREGIEKTFAGGGTLDVFKVFRYVLAALVAVTAMIIAVRRFGDTFTQSVISVGRNPLARPQIRSILLWNALLIVLVSGVGFAIAAAIILFP